MDKNFRDPMPLLFINIMSYQFLMVFLPMFLSVYVGEKPLN